MYTLRPVNLGDADDLFAWKNDPVTRAFAIVGRDLIEWADHLNWLKKRLEAPGYYMILEGDSRLGTIRFDEDGEVAIIIAPKHRGNGVAREILGPAVSLYQCITKKSLWAKIVDGNQASMALFTKAGFAPVSRANDRGVLYSVLTRASA